VDEQTGLPFIEIAPADLRLIGYNLFSYPRIVHITIKRSLKCDTLVKISEALRQRLVALKLSEEEGVKPLRG
jgi:hypothetical protein